VSHLVNPEGSVGRKKSYDRDELVEEAMEVFRDHGYAGTSAEMLVQHLDVNRFSLYAEFGSKQGLFDAALERYDQVVVERNFGPLESPGAGVAEIAALFRFFGAAGEGPVSGRGCLLCNTAVEFGPDDPSGAGFVPRYLERISSAFHSALEASRAEGDLHPDVELAAEAAYLTATVLGMFVMLRAKAPPAALRAAAQSAVRHLGEFCIEPERMLRPRHPEPGRDFAPGSLM
jgi:TetR/AcrR family transcriptional repressor of nem operon